MMSKKTWEEIINYLNENEGSELVYEGLQGRYILDNNEIFPENRTWPEEIQCRPYIHQGKEVFGSLQLCVSGQIENE